MQMNKVSLCNCHTLWKLLEYAAPEPSANAEATAEQTPEGLGTAATEEFEGGAQILVGNCAFALPQQRCSVATEEFVSVQYQLLVAKHHVAHRKISALCMMLVMCASHFGPEAVALLPLRARTGCEEDLPRLKAAFLILL